MPDEWCCGNTLYSVGMIDEARELAKRNLRRVRATGAKTLITSCAEGYRMWKVDYPKMLDMATADLGFEVIHLLEYADAMLKKGALKLTKPVEARMTYHDSCGVSRLCDPWTPWKGERGVGWACEPGLKRRRGTEGLYAQPRNILKAIPGVEFAEMTRTRENSFCCSAGRGTMEAYPDLASSSAKHRLEEVREVGAEVLVSSCPWCKDNFAPGCERKWKSFEGNGHIRSDWLQEDKEVSMTIVKEAYKALESIVGPKYISDDPAICEGYRSGPGGYEAGCGYEKVMTKIPGVVILPRTTEEVQKIVKIL